MTTVELIPYDLLTASPARIMAPSRFWAGLTRLTGGRGTARLLMVTDILRAADVLRGFDRVAVPPAELPTQGLRLYRAQYEQFVREHVPTTRLMRLFLTMDSRLPEAGLVSLLASYGMRARPLTGHRGIPLPFTEGRIRWNRLHAPDGMRWALVRSTLEQPGSFLVTVLHRLWSLDFPVWASLDVWSYSPQEATRFLTTKEVSARWERSPNGSAQQMAHTVRETVMALQEEMARAGAGLHTVRLNLCVGAADEARLQERLEVVRASAGLVMEGWESDAGGIGAMFAPTAPTERDGALVTSVGLALLSSSALSYGRRAETRGILVGTDAHQAPVILDLFDERYASHNVVVIGQTGYGKTFTLMLLMKRHLLTGRRLVIVDPKGDIDLAWLGEEVVQRVELGTAQAAINILDIVQEEIAQQVELVVALLGMLGVVDPASRLERAVLDLALVDLYRPLWGRGGEVPPLGALQRRLQDLAADPERAPAAQEAAGVVALALDPFVSGSYKDLFGQRTTVDLSLRHPVTLFDISHLPGQEQGSALRAALLAILVGSVHRALGQLKRAGATTQTLFLIDEIGVLLRDSVLAAYVSSMFKTARGLGVSMIVADQEVGSLLGTADAQGRHHGAMMLSTAEFRLFFRQKANDLPRLRELFGDIPAPLLAQLPELPKGGHCLLQTPEDVLRVKIDASPFEVALLGSGLHERARQQRLIAQVQEGAEANVNQP